MKTYQRQYKLKSLSLNYTYASLILINTAAALLIIVLITNYSDIINATLILAGISCFIGGVLLLTFSKGEHIDSGVASLLPVQGSINTCQIYTDLSVRGKAHFIPFDKSVIQYLPVSEEFHPPTPLVRTPFKYYNDKKNGGVFTIPTSAPLLTLLEKEYHLIIPREDELLFESIKEVIVDVLEVSKQISFRCMDSTILVDLHNFRLYNGCKVVQEKSSNCCTMSPCPVCSLIVCMLAKGMQKTITINQVLVENKDRSIRLVLTSISHGS